VERAEALIICIAATAAENRDNQRTAKDGRKLSYSIELWDLDARALERVLARAFSPQFARAIFRAAQKEQPDQRILLRRGTRTVADSAD
jgi:hypothetical protein